MQPSAYSATPARSAGSGGASPRARRSTRAGPATGSRTRTGTCPPSGNATRQQPDRHERAGDHGGAPGAGSDPPRARGQPGDRVRRAGERGEQRRHRAAERGQHTPARSPSRSPALERERRRRAPGEQPERERQPARVQVRRRRGAEPQRAEPRVVAEVVARERLEQRCGRRRRRSRPRAAASAPPRAAGTGRCSRGTLWPAYHQLFQSPKPSLVEQLRAEQVGGEVEARRRHDHVDEREPGRDRGRRGTAWRSSAHHSPGPRNAATASITLRAVEPRPVAGVGDRSDGARPAGARRTRPPSSAASHGSLLAPQDQRRHRELAAARGPPRAHRAVAVARCRRRIARCVPWSNCSQTAVRRRSSARRPR